LIRNTHHVTVLAALATLTLAAVTWPWFFGQARAETVLVSATAQSGTSLYGFNEAQAVTFSSPSGLDNAYGTQVMSFSGSGGGAMLGSYATVTHALAGARSVTMNWRVRTLNESFLTEPGGNPSQPPLRMDGLYFGNASDVVELTGFGAGEAFVLQMSYTANPAWFNEAEEILTKSIHIAWLDPASGLWTNASVGNTNNSSDRVINYAGSWADYRDSQISAGKNPLTMGSWGVDATNDVAWMVLDHNSEFAVTPEPPTVMLAGLGAGCFVAWRYRRGPRVAGRLARRKHGVSQAIGAFLAAFLGQIALYGFVGTALAG
jgi:hypothetical protein